MKKEVATRAEAFELAISTNWGGYTILDRGVPDIDPPKTPALRGIRKRCRIEVLRNGISGILRPSQCVIMSFYNLESSTQTPLLDLTQTMKSQQKTIKFKRSVNKAAITSITCNRIQN